MELTLKEAKDLYNAGFKDIALRVFKEEKILKKILPKNWEELGTFNGYYIENGIVKETIYNNCINRNKDIFPKKEYCDAVLALAQLLQLRKKYIEDWIPDWSNFNMKYVITNYKNKIRKDLFRDLNCILSFPTEELRNEFFDNFQDLLEQAKILL